MGTTYRIDPPPAPVRPIPTVGTSEDPSVADWWSVAGGFALLLAAWWVATNLIHDPGYGTAQSTPAPVEGLTIFAVFFVAATALERLLEPISMILKTGPEKDLRAAESDPRWP